MSPRPAPSRVDATAMKFLDAAASLIDAALAESGTDIPARLRALHFPAALEWMRTEDVVRTASERDEASSRKAFRNRWPTKDDFVSDAIVHALLYRDMGGSAAPNSVALFGTTRTGPGTLSERVSLVTDTIEIELARHPRSWLLAHIAPLLGRHPTVAEPMVAATREDHDMWIEFFRAMLDESGIVLRPGWSAERIQMSLQCMLDGVLIRRRVDPERFHNPRWASAHEYTDLVMAFLCGIADPDRTGLTNSEWLDQMSAASTTTEG